MKAADKEMLELAIKALGLKYVRSGERFSITTPAGALTIDGGTAEYRSAGVQDWVNKIKQSYSLKAVEKVAKKYNFTITTKPGNKLTLRRY